MPLEFNTIAPHINLHLLALMHLHDTGGVRCEKSYIRRVIEERERDRVRKCVIASGGPSVSLALILTDIINLTASYSGFCSVSCCSFDYTHKAHLLKKKKTF